MTATLAAIQLPAVVALAVSVVAVLSIVPIGLALIYVAVNNVILFERARDAIGEAKRRTPVR